MLAVERCGGSERAGDGGDEKKKMTEECARDGD